MRTEELTDAERALITRAEELLDDRFERGRHRCASAVRTGSGEVYTGINVLTDLGLVDVHAEPVAIGRAATAGETNIETVVAVMYEDDVVAESMHVVSACGVCREFIHDVAPDTRVIVSLEGKRCTVPIEDLLPARP